MLTFLAVFPLLSDFIADFVSPYVAADWVAPGTNPYSGECYAIMASRVDHTDGSTESNTPHLNTYQIAVSPTSTLSSITLSNNISALKPSDEEVI